MITKLRVDQSADRFFVAVVSRAPLRRYISSEHFSVDGNVVGGVGVAQEFPAEGQAEIHTAEGPQ
jgi:hypothetical protein